MSKKWILILVVAAAAWWFWKRSKAQAGEVGPRL